MECRLHVVAVIAWAFTALDGTEYSMRMYIFILSLCLPFARISIVCYIQMMFQSSFVLEFGRALDQYLSLQNNGRVAQRVRVLIQRILHWDYTVVAWSGVLEAAFGSAPAVRHQRCYSGPSEADIVAARQVTFAYRIF